MKTRTKSASLLIVALCLSSVAIAVTDTATQDVTITFSEIATITVSGDPGTITFTTPATPGDLPADQTDNSTTMSWTSNVDAGMTRKITANIDTLFTNVDLYAEIDDAGSNGTSAGQTQFVAAGNDYDFLTGITNENVSDNTITYTASVTAMTAPYTDTHTVTWTLTEDS